MIPLTTRLFSHWSIPLKQITALMSHKVKAMERAMIYVKRFRLKWFWQE